MEIIKPHFGEFLISLEIEPSESSISGYHDILDVIKVLGATDMASYDRIENNGDSYRLYILIEFCQWSLGSNFETSSGTIFELHSTIDYIYAKKLYSEKFKIGDQRYCIVRDSLKIEYFDLDLDINYTESNIIDRINHYGKSVAQYSLMHSSRQTLHMYNTNNNIHEKPIFDIFVNGMDTSKYPDYTPRYCMEGPIHNTSVRYYTGFIYELESKIEIIDSMLYKTIMSIFPSFYSLDKYYNYADFINIKYAEVILTRAKNRFNLESLDDTELLDAILKVVDTNIDVLVYKEKFMRSNSLIPSLTAVIEILDLDESLVSKILDYMKDIVKHKYSTLSIYNSDVRCINTQTNHILFNLYRALTNISFK